MQPELLYFRWSHYNEKVRWALEYKGIAHLRRTLLPGLHVARARQLTGQTALPILVLDGRAIADSTRIIAALEAAYPQRPLYPRDPVQQRRALELEEYFDEELGPHARRVVFHACLPHTVYCAHLFDAEAGLLRRWAYRLLLHRAKHRLARRLKTDPASIAHSWQRIDAALDRIEREVRPGGYLVGSAFSIADLTAAAMLSVLTLPPDFPCLPLRPRPESVSAASRRIEHRAAYRWARDIYERHRESGRPARAADLHVVPGPAAS